ncbi:hypothetical protein [Methylobacterium sp. 1030]|uniref:hypothetical protein n=1 Tax=Methylobacterium sp. 1030 TaxID=3156404 RepID=UPI0033914D94
MRYAFAAMILAFAVEPAMANMPMLTPLPSPATAEACQRWAAAQGEEAREMWGVMESGKYLPEVGALRLSLMCLGDKPPAIVGFGSSAGGDAAYCKANPRTPICREHR